MKRTIVAGLAIFLLGSLATMFPQCLGDSFHYQTRAALASESLIPAPFDAAKRYAMAAPPDQDGDYVLKFDFTEDGEQSRIALGYLVKDRQIVIFKDYAGFVCQEETGTLQAGIVTAYGIMEVNIPDEKIIEECFKIFRELVARNLLEVSI